VRFVCSCSILPVWYVGAWEVNSFRLLDLYEAGFGDGWTASLFCQVSVTAFLMGALAVLSCVVALFSRIRPRSRRATTFLAFAASLAAIAVYVQMIAIYGMLGSPRAWPDGGTWWFIVAICAIFAAQACGKK
jgi:cytochrome b561